MADAISIRVRGASKKRFCINGDPDKVIEINTSDTGILERLEGAYKDLIAASERAVNIKGDIEDIEIDSPESKALYEELSAINKKLCDAVDYIFDSKVAAACSGGGKMYDPVDGYFRVEVILDDLMSVLSDDLQAELAKITERRDQHTAKYRK